MKPNIHLILGAALAAALTCHAAPLTGWVSIFDPQNNTPRFQPGTEATASPITTHADQDSIMANFTSVTLADEDFIIITGTVTIDVNIPTGQFRVGLFDGPTATQDVGNPYLGFYTEVPTNAATDLKWGPGTHSAHAFGGGTTVVDDFLTTGGAVSAGTALDFSLTIIRDGDKLDIESSYQTASGHSSSNRAEDVDVLAIKADYNYTFDSAGFLLAGSLNGNQASFTNIDVTAGGPGTDNDNDGMLDLWEIDNGLRVGVDDTGDDPENGGAGDGLTNLQEYQGKDGTPFTGDETDPQDPDTDGDGIEDGPEITLGTDPTDTDSDDDFFEDGYEVAQGTLPADPTSYPLPTAGYFIDFSSNGTNSQDGPRHDVDYLPFVADHERDDSNAGTNFLSIERPVSHPVPAFTGTPTVTLTVAYPDATDPRVKQMIGRTDALQGGGFATTYEGEHRDLVRDWIGIDSRAGSGGNGSSADTTMTLTLSGIPAGIYQYRGFHHDVANMQNSFDLALTDATGPNVSLGQFRMTHGNDNGLSPLTQPGTGNQPSVLPSTIEFLFTSNGTDDIVISYAIVEDESTLFNSFLAVNAIEVTTAVDTDGDGIPDGSDLRPGINDTGLTSDADSLTDLREFHLGTKLDDPDTDGDGFFDDVESNTGTWTDPDDTGTSPWVADWDGDGLLDGVETYDLDFSDWPTAAGTDPFDTDTDGDGFADGLEAASGWDPTDANSVPKVIAQLTTVDVAGGTATIEWTSLNNGTATYDIYASDTLTGDPLVDWTVVATAVPTGGATTSHTETQTDTLPTPMPAKRFYAIYEFP